MFCAALAGADLEDISHQICQTRHPGLFWGKSENGMTEMIECGFMVAV